MIHKKPIIPWPSRINAREVTFPHIDIKHKMMQNDLGCQYFVINLIKQQRLNIVEISPFTQNRITHPQISIMKVNIRNLRWDASPLPCIKPKATIVTPNFILEPITNFWISMLDRGKQLWTFVLHHIVNILNGALIMNKLNTKHVRAMENIPNKLSNQSNIMKSSYSNP